MSTPSEALKKSNLLLNTTPKTPWSRHKALMYAVWYSMHQRCEDPRAANYKYYGGRGIVVCERWGDYDTWLVDMGPRPEGYSIDRIDNNKGYCPENCRWASPATQRRNQRPRNTAALAGVVWCVNKRANDDARLIAAFTGTAAKPQGYWRVHMGARKLGRYPDLFSAACARKSAELRYTV